jgi:DNA polymerase-3 subunit chi
VPEFRFLHLERRRVDQALPDLLERVSNRGSNIVVQAASPEEVEALNERLWTYSDENFLPHGSKRDGDAEHQPIYLTDEPDNPNSAEVRVLLSGVEAAPFAGSAYERVFLMFDGRDEEAVVRARQQWTKVKAAGEPMSYWREGDDGGWVKVR